MLVIYRDQKGNKKRHHDQDGEKAVQDETMTRLNPERKSALTAFFLLKGVWFIQIRGLTQEGLEGL